MDESELCGVWYLSKPIISNLKVKEKHVPDHKPDCKNVGEMNV